MRKTFDEQLKQLNIELIAMGAMCEQVIKSAVLALFGNSEEERHRVLVLEVEIDQKERDIEAMCMRLLLRQQPVARDLRLISAAMKMISDMERIGDQAADIAEITKYMQGKPIPISYLGTMAEKASKMVTDSITSFVERDMELVYSVYDQDDAVDDLFCRVKQDLAVLLKEQQDAELCIDCLMIAKYLERIGDHAVNVAEWVEFAITGSHKKGAEVGV